MNIAFEKDPFGGDTCSRSILVTSAASFSLSKHTSAISSEYLRPAGNLNSLKNGHYNGRARPTSDRSFDTMIRPVSAHRSLIAVSC